jgi:hypothetical protein
MTTLSVANSLRNASSENEFADEICRVAGGFAERNAEADKIFRVHGDLGFFKIKATRGGKRRR